MITRTARGFEGTWSVFISVLSLIAALAGLPQFALLDPIRFIPELGAVAVDEGNLSAAPLVPGDFASLEYEAMDGLGRSMGNSLKRGMGFDLRVGDPISDPLFDILTAGLAPGTTRTCLFWSKDAEAMTGGLFPPATTICIKLRILPPKAR